MAEKVRGLFGNRANDPEFDVEMQEHMRLLAERYMRQRMAPGRGPKALAQAKRLCGLDLQDVGSLHWTRFELLRP